MNYSTIFRQIRQNIINKKTIVKWKEHQSFKILHTKIIIIVEDVIYGSLIQNICL